MQCPGLQSDASGLIFVQLESDFRHDPRNIAGIGVHQIRQALDLSLIELRRHSGDIDGGLSYRRGQALEHFTIDIRLRLDHSVNSTVPDQIIDRLDATTVLGINAEFLIQQCDPLCRSQIIGVNHRVNLLLHFRSHFVLLAETDDSKAFSPVHGRSDDTHQFLLIDSQIV